MFCKIDQHLLKLFSSTVFATSSCCVGAGVFSTVLVLIEGTWSPPHESIVHGAANLHPLHKFVVHSETVEFVRGGLYVN